MFKPRWPVLAALLLLAALLAALPGAASAQTPTWEEGDSGGGELAITDTVEVVGGWKCARQASGSPVAFDRYNDSYEFYGVCVRLKAAAPQGRFAVHYASAAGLERAPNVGFSSGNFTTTGTGYGSWSDPEESTQLGFTTTAITRECSSSSACGQAVKTKWAAVSAGDTVTVTVYAPSLSGSGEPSDPEKFTVSRNPEYSQATVSWELYDPVGLYQIERLEAVIVEAGDNTRIEYGNPKLIEIEGTYEGTDSYVDTTISPGTSYTYRIRARGGQTGTWNDWSAYVLSGQKPALDLDAPSNLQFSRTQDNSETTVSWTAPEGDFDNYTLQRQELVIVEGSTIFANAVTLDGSGWLPGNTTTYTDDSFLPGRTYEYRVAAVKDDLIGDYSDWSRSSPVQTSLGVAPENFRFVSGNGSRLLDRRREFWMRWDEVDGADDYEVDVLVYDVATGGQAIENYIVTDPTYFRTSYGRVEVRVRGRRSDDTLCGDSDGTVETGEDCYSEWTGWYGVNFTPKATVAAPPLADDTADASIMELRADTEEVIESSLAAAGAPVDAGLVVQFLTLIAATVIGGVSVALGWRLGMAPLGVGMGAAIAILILFTGYRLFGVPLAWPVSIQAALAVAGLFAAVRQTGVFR